MPSLVPATAGGVIGAAVVTGVLALTGSLGGDDSTRTITVASQPGSGSESPTTTTTTPAPAIGGSVRALYAATAPAVVYVEAVGGGSADANSPFPDPRQGDGETATGSGFVVDTDGTIVTNAHVVGTSKDVTVRFDEDDEPIDAKVAGVDVSTDVAVLEIDPGKVKGGLTKLELAADGEVKVGDVALAIGAPFGLERTATAGIVSAVNRRIDAPNNFAIDDAVQTDAPINPGNSGGPLIDAQGHVIGINSQILTGAQGTASSSTGNVGIGFAVPAATVREVVPKLKADGKIDRAYLGVSTGKITAEVAKSAGLTAGTKGALVASVTDGSPADDAGVKAPSPTTGRGNDVITKVGDTAVSSPDDVSRLVSARKPGDTIKLTVLRNGKSKTLDVKLGNRPKEATP